MKRRALRTAVATVAGTIALATQVQAASAAAVQQAPVDVGVPSGGGTATASSGLNSVLRNDNAFFVLKSAKLPEKYNAELHTFYSGVPANPTKLTLTYRAKSNYRCQGVFMLWDFTRERFFEVWRGATVTGTEQIFNAWIGTSTDPTVEQPSDFVNANGEVEGLMACERSGAFTFKTDQAYLTYE